MSAEPDLTRWLLGDGMQLGGMEALLLGLTGQLQAAGVPVDRLTCGEPTLHPEALAFTYRWTIGDAYVQAHTVRHGVQHMDVYNNSPFRLIYGNETEQIRQPLSDDIALELPIYQELRDDGFTDYLALAITYSNGDRAPVTIATKAREGFTDAAVETMRGVLPALGLVAEVHAARRLTHGLLETYLGHDAGAQVLAGHVRRGDTQVIDAVIWYCDLRGFTGLSDRLPADFLIHVLNDYFEVMGAAVQNMQGEILKFMGDAMLAIFRIDDGDDRSEVCERALTAAELALAGMRRLNRRRGREGKPDLHYGLALHVGDVMYGNIGASGRLDFTVIGPAVNLAARLEQLAASQGETLITSAEFAAACPDPRLVSLGRHQLKGIATAQEAFTVRAASGAGA